MIAALSLLAYALTLAVAGPRLLRAASWADRAPRLAIAAWQALTVTVLASAVLAGAALTFPTMGVSRDLAGLLRACIMAIQEQYASPGGAAAAATGAILALGILGRTLWCVGLVLGDMARERARHGSILDIVGRDDTHPGVIVLDSDESTVYCLPGRRRRTVVTTAALRVLDAAQLDAVLAHEQAHLTERHDLILGFSRSLAAAFPGIAPFQLASAETARLIELRADDAAAARSGRLTVAGALLAVASPAKTPLPAVALAAGGAGAAARVRRLIPPHNPLGRTRTAAGSLAVAALFALPVLLLGGPAAATAGHNFCPDIAASASSTTP